MRISANTKIDPCGDGTPNCIDYNIQNVPQKVLNLIGQPVQRGQLLGYLHKTLFVPVRGMSNQEGWLWLSKVNRETGLTSLFLPEDFAGRDGQLHYAPEYGDFLN